MHFPRNNQTVRMNMEIDSPLGWKRARILTVYGCFDRFFPPRIVRQLGGAGLRRPAFHVQSYGHRKVGTKDRRPGAATQARMPLKSSRKKKGRFFFFAGLLLVGYLHRSCYGAPDLWSIRCWLPTSSILAS